MLKNKRTYEIMDASTIGLNTGKLVLGKHSGKHALARQLESMGYHLNQEEIKEVFLRFKDLADKKKNVSEADLEALVATSYTSLSRRGNSRGPGAQRPT